MKTKKIKAKNVRTAMVEKEAQEIPMPIGAEEQQITISVKPRLSLSERKRFVDGTTNMCFIEDTQSGQIQYCPYVQKFSFEYHMVLFFTNIEMPDDVEDACGFLEETNIAERIADIVGKEYINGLLHECKELIDYQKDALLKKTPLDKVLTSVSGIISSLKTQIDEGGAEAIIKYMDEHVPNFKEEMSKVFEEQQEVHQTNT